MDTHSLFTDETIAPLAVSLDYLHVLGHGLDLGLALLGLELVHILLALFVAQ